MTAEQINEQGRRAKLAHRIRQVGRGHREPVALYRTEDDEAPAAVGVVQAIETEGVRIAGSLVPWSGLRRVERAPAEPVNLVCPNCGSDRIGTRESAEIWQRARFTLASDGDFETPAGERVELDWEAYESDDVGDTETVGFFCGGCSGCWDKDDGVPFVPAGTPPTNEWKAY